MKPYSLIFGLLALVCLFAAAPPTLASPLAAFELATDPGTTTLKPGDPAHTNEDGVTAENPSGSGGNVTINPTKGDKNSKTTVKTKTNAEFSVSGLDENDTVDMGSSNAATISGKGGTVNMKGNSTATVTNTADKNGKDITVNTPNGGTVTVKPGCTVPISTP